MVEIIENQTLEIDNVLSFRGNITQAEFEAIGKDMEAKLVELGAKRCQHPITATYSVSDNTMEVEILIPIDKKVKAVGKYVFKDKIKIVNAVVLKYKGNPMRLQEACNELNTYIAENKLQPITVGYNVTKNVDMINIENTEIDVYVGISPNIL